MPTNIPQAISHNQPSPPPRRSKCKSNIQKESKERKINNGSLIVTAWTWNISLLETNNAARTTPAVSEGVIRQPRIPSNHAFKPKIAALTQRAPRRGSTPNRPKNARTEEKAGGKCVTGPLEASHASRYPAPAAILRAPAIYAIESSERPNPSG